MKKILQRLLVFDPDYWLGIYGIYYCIMLITSDGYPFLIESILPLIALASIQLFKKGRLLHIVYAIFIVTMISLALA